MPNVRKIRALVVSTIRGGHGRNVAVMTHDTDIGDSWEREGEGPNFFYQFLLNRYVLGINVLLSIMAH